MKTSYKDKFFYFLFIGFVLFLDQLTKWMVTEMIIRGKNGKLALDFITWMQHAPEKLSYIEFPITSFFNIVMVWNYGVSFGMFNTQDDQGALILSILAMILVLILLIWMMDTKNRTQGLCLALIIGGAIGNVFDRMRFGAVIDFLDIHVYGYHWPAFNIADSCIVIGVFFLILHITFFDKELKTENTQTKQDGGAQ